MKQDNPFSKLGALDQKLYQDTVPRPQGTDEQDAGNPEVQKSGIPEINKSSNIEKLNTRNQVTQQSRNPETRTPTKREFFTKATYRLCNEALDAIGDAKNILKRQYKVKVNLEEIVETAVLAAFRDLAENKEKSILVTKYSGNPEIQNT